MPESWFIHGANSINTVIYMDNLFKFFFKSKITEEMGVQSLLVKVYESTIICRVCAGGGGSAEHLTPASKILTA